MSKLTVIEQFGEPEICKLESSQGCAFALKAIPLKINKESKNCFITIV
jgi:hypothetical protein